MVARFSDSVAVLLRFCLCLGHNLQMGQFGTHDVSNARPDTVGKLTEVRFPTVSGWAPEPPYMRSYAHLKFGTEQRYWFLK